jgi:hypothetical protein
MGIRLKRSRPQQIEGYLDGVLDTQQFLFRQPADPRTKPRLVDRPDLVAEDPRGRAADLDSSLAGIERFNVARDREDDDAGPVAVAGIVRDDDSGASLPNLGPEGGVEDDLKDIAAARRVSYAGQSSVSVLDQSDARRLRHGFRAAAL